MSENPAELNAAGLRALGAGQLGAAVALLRRAVAADPGAPQLWYNLSNALRAAGDHTAEETAIDEALTRDPYFDHALLAKGRLLEDRGEARDALTHYQRLLAAIDPTQPMGPGFAAGVAHARAALDAAANAITAQLDAVLESRLAAAPDAATERFRHCVDIGLGRRRIYHH